MTDDFSGHCSQPETIQMAMRCKKLGLRVMIDFHYSDSWCSVGSQTAPKAWASMSYTDMKTALSNYVTGFCKAMKDSGVTPEWFQNGNEENSGICPPVGARSSHPDQMTGLLNAGYDAMKAVFPKAKVLIHVAQPQKIGGSQMLDAYLKYNGKLDALGWSSYANDGNVLPIIDSVKKWHDKYNLESIMVEIGSSTLATNESLINKWNAGIQAMNKPCEGGTFYWEPEGYGAPANWADAIFDKSGKPMAAFNAYKTPISKACSIVSILKTISSQNSGYKPVCFLNASHDKILIQEKGNFKYGIFDMDGRQIMSGAATDAATVGQKLKSGMYLVKVINQNKTQIVKISKY